MAIALCPVVLFSKVEPFCVPKEFLMRRLILYIGVAILVFGAGPLLIIVLLSKIGIGDPNPNPVGPGMLAMISFWPGIFMTCLGAWPWRRNRA